MFEAWYFVTILTINDDRARSLALENESVQRHLAGREPRKVIVVPKKLVNIVV